MNITRLMAPAVAALSLTALGAASHAATTAHAPAFSSGLPNGLGGNEMTAWTQANEFDLTSASDLGSVEFWDLERLDSYQGSIFWTIYGNDAGSPGAVLASGDASSVTRTATGESGFGLAEFSDAFSLGSVPLAAGDYWLGLHNGQLSSDSVKGFYWETTGPDGLAPGQEQIVADAGSFASNGSAHAFTLSAAPAENTPSPASVSVPEPSPFALMGIGLFALAGVMRRRMRPIPR